MDWPRRALQRTMHHVMGVKPSKVRRGPHPVTLNCIAPTSTPYVYNHTFASRLLALFLIKCSFSTPASAEHHDTTSIMRVPVHNFPLVASDACSRSTIGE